MIRLRASVPSVGVLGITDIAASPSYFQRCFDFMTNPSKSQTVGLRLVQLNDGAGSTSSCIVSGLLTFIEEASYLMFRVREPP
jgi:hypothetical protein